MKTSFILIPFIAFMTCISFGHAQDKKERTYKIWVKLNQKDLTYKGQLKNLKDSSIVIQYWHQERILEIPVKEINKLKITLNGTQENYVGIGPELNKFLSN